MQRRWLTLYFAGIMLITACQPQEITLEVTRLVEVGGEEVVVEVTRIVQETLVEEATRLVTDEVVIEVTKSPLGSPARPVQLLFPPTVDTAVLNQRADILAQSLTAETGYQFVAGILDDEATVIETMCAAPMETIGFLSPSGYVLAEAACGAVPGNVAIHDDALSWGTGMLVTRRGEGLTAIEDLAGKKWAVADTDSLANFHYFRALLQDAGIEPGEIIEVSGESAAMLALYEGDVDFATAEFIPPIMPYEERLWDYEEDDPEPHRFLGIPPTRSPIGYVVVNGEPEFGGYRLRDARSRIFDVAPDIYERTVILALSAQMPNETVAFGPDFPLGLSQQVVTALTEYAASDACGDSLCSADFYGWTGLEPVVDETFEPIRFIQKTLALSAEDMLGEAR